MRIALLILALLVAGAGAFVYAGYRRDIDRAFERISTGKQIIQTRCGAIEFASVGDGEPVLAVHGAGGGFDQGMDLTKGLAAAGLRVIAMSRFGYLGTPLPADASAVAQADAHACLLDALGIHRVAVLGASAGAPSSLQFALRYPERCAALVLLVPAAYVPRPGGAPSVSTPAWNVFLFDTALRSDFLFWAALRVAPRTLMGSILGTPPDLVDKADSDEQARVAEILEHILPVSPRRKGLVNEVAVTGALPRYELESIRAPTLAISTADDRYGTFEAARYTAEHIPGARFIGYPSGGHLLVGHKEVQGEIVAFLKANYR